MMGENEILDLDTVVFRLSEYVDIDLNSLNKENLVSTIKLMVTRTPRERCVNNLKLIISLLKRVRDVSLKNKFQFASAINNHAMAQTYLCALVNSSIVDNFNSKLDDSKCNHCNGNKKIKPRNSRSVSPRRLKQVDNCYRSISSSDNKTIRSHSPRYHRCSSPDDNRRGHCSRGELKPNDCKTKSSPTHSVNSFSPKNHRADAYRNCRQFSPCDYRTKAYCDHRAFSPKNCRKGRSCNRRFVSLNYCRSRSHNCKAVSLPDHRTESSRNRRGSPKLEKRRSNRNDKRSLSQSSSSDFEVSIKKAKYNRPPIGKSNAQSYKEKKIRHHRHSESEYYSGSDDESPVKTKSGITKTRKNYHSCSDDSSVKQRKDKVVRRKIVERLSSSPPQRNEGKLRGQHSPRYLSSSRSSSCSSDQSEIEQSNSHNSRRSLSVSEISEVKTKSNRALSKNNSKKHDAIKKKNTTPENSRSKNNPAKNLSKSDTPFMARLKELENSFKNPPIKSKKKKSPLVRNSQSKESPAVSKSQSKKSQAVSKSRSKKSPAMAITQSKKSMAVTKTQSKKLTAVTKTQNKKSQVVSKAQNKKASAAAKTESKKLPEVEKTKNNIVAATSNSKIIKKDNTPNPNVCQNKKVIKKTPAPKKQVRKQAAKKTTTNKAGAQKSKIKKPAPSSNDSVPKKYENNQEKYIEKPLPENRENDQVKNHVGDKVNNSVDSFSSDDLDFDSEPELGTLSACLNSIKRKQPLPVGSATPPMNVFLSPYSSSYMSPTSSVGSSFADVPMKIDDKNVVKRMAKANKPKEMNMPINVPEKLESTPEALRKMMKIQQVINREQDSDIDCSSFAVESFRDE